MNCQQCGAPLAAGAKFCEVCGSPVKAPKNVNTGTYANPAGSVNQNAFASQNAYVNQNEASSPYRFSNYGSESNDGDFNVNQGFDTKAIRKWFRREAGGIAGSIILIIIGVPFLAIGVGIIPIVIGILRLVSAFSAKDTRMVDEAWNSYANVLSKRGMDKLNVIDEQVNLIDPIILVGFGESPDETFALARNTTGKKDIASLNPSKKTNGTELDPYEAKRIGTDDVLRSMLMSVTVYRFSEEQLLIYKGNIDISTGLIYRESTNELFYKDIEAIYFEQSIFKVYSTKRKMFVNKLEESIGLHLSGTDFHASYRSGMDDSVIKKQFSAMRNLIRDKKNA